VGGRDEREDDGTVRPAGSVRKPDEDSGRGGVEPDGSAGMIGGSYDRADCVSFAENRGHRGSGADECPQHPSAT